MPGLFDVIRDTINSWLRSDSYRQHKDNLEDLQISIDQEILDTGLIEEQHEEERKARALARDLKAEGVAQRKRLRAEKAEKTLKLKEEKKAQKKGAISQMTSEGPRA